jgi:hypothetical protein
LQSGSAGTSQPPFFLDLFARVGGRPLGSTDSEILALCDRMKDLSSLVFPD